MAADQRNVDQEDQSAVRRGIVLRVAAVCAYLCALLAALGVGGLGGLALAFGAGFALGAFTAGWWACVAVGVVAGLLALGNDSNSFGLVVVPFPASVAFGVLGAKMRRSESGHRAAPRMAQAGAVILLIGVLGLVVAFAGYNDDAPTSVAVDVGFGVGLVGFTVGPGLFCAGLVGSVGRSVSS